MQYSSAIKKYWNRLSITTKMISILVAVWLVLWVSVEYVTSITINKVLDVHLYNILSRQATEQRIEFDRYLRLYNQAVRILAKQKNFIDYTESPQWKTKRDVTIVHTDLPSWLPQSSVLRLLVNIRYALLIDAQGSVREVYQGSSEPLPPSLLKPAHLITTLSHEQTLLTEVAGTPMLISSESLPSMSSPDSATLMLVEPIDEYFLSSAFHTGAYESTITALITGEPAIIAVSSKPDVIPRGTALDLLSDDYLILGRKFFDYGSSDLRMGFATLIPRQQVKVMGKSIMQTERIQHTVITLIFLITFSIIIVWITKRIVKLTSRVTDYSEMTLGIKPYDPGRGDQIIVLEDSFRWLTDEISKASETIRKDAKYKTIKAEELKQKDRQLRLLQTVSDATSTGVLVSDKDKLMAGNSQMERFISRFGTAERFLPKGDIKEELTIKDSTGEECVFEITRLRPEITAGEDIVLVHDITEQRNYEQNMQRSLKEKEVLLQEIHHRVKNNMQIISSLLKLQSAYIKDENIVNLFNEGHDRVRAMALVHEKLYRSKDFVNIDLKSYVDDLTQTLLRSYSTPDVDYELKVEVGNVSFGIETAIPCGLIINELVSNSIKHAFKGISNGLIFVSLNRLTDGRIELIVSDNGIGLPEGLDIREAESLGLKLVTTLAEDQLNGNIKINSRRPGGTEFKISFEELKYNRRF